MLMLINGNTLVQSPDGEGLTSKQHFLLGVEYEAFQLNPNGISSATLVAHSIDTEDHPPGRTKQDLQFYGDNGSRQGISGSNV